MSREWLWQFTPVWLFSAAGLLAVGSVLHRRYAPGARSAEILLFIAIAATFAALAGLGRRAPGAPLAPKAWDAPLAVLLVSFYAGAAAQLATSIDIANRTQMLVRSAGLTLVLACVLLIPHWAYVAPERLRPAWVRRWNGRAAVWFLLGAALVLKIVAILAEPKPAIDVWDVLQDGARMLADGKNPFGGTMVNSLNSGAAFGNAPPTYVYPPAVLLMTFPFVAWAGDSRWLYVVTDLAAALLLLGTFGGPRFGGRMRRCAELGALFVMLHPRSLGKTWTDLVALPFVFVIIRGTLVRGRDDRVAAAAAGLLFALKQYMIFLAPIVMPQFRRARSWIIAGTVAAATFVPFVAWDARALYRSIVEFHFKTPFRDDSMNIASFLHHTAHVRTPTWMGVAMASACMLAGASLARTRGLAAALSWGGATFLLLFAGGSYAFPNYYHFVTALLIGAAFCALAEHEDPAAWQATTDGTPPSGDRTPPGATAGPG